jgi:hypothetical protein
MSSWIKCRALLVIAVLCACSAPGCKVRKTLSQVSFVQSAQNVEAYDFVEVTAKVSWPYVKNPFTDATLGGWFETLDGKKRWQVGGFCDSENGSAYRIRFMPPSAGDYRYFVEYRQDDGNRTFSGTFHANTGSRHGPIRVDPQNRWHFIWEGTGEHYFFNGTTAYWLMGWNDEKVIEASIDRLHRLKVNRMRVTLAGRSNRFFGEPVMVGDNWTLYLTAWPARLPEDVYHPGFDYERFEVSYWQKFERMLRFARERDMIISVVLDMNDSQIHPEAESEDERRFIDYAVARFSAFSNITWDLGDDLDQYRSEQWTHDTGEYIVRLDPYHHLATSHPVSNSHQDRGSGWFGFTSFQEWSRNQHPFMLKQRMQQIKTGQIIPQTNEEYGYEDHYPLFALPNSDTADTLRRTAWDIVMAGGYQTTGETARRGTNVLPDTGGGWMNGRGDDTMTMLQGYAHMVDFFTGFDWWKAEPHDELVNKGNYCLAKPGELYAVYLPHGGQTTVRLGLGFYTAIWFNPRTGEKTPLSDVEGAVWNSLAAPDNEDWALLLQKK